MEFERFFDGFEMELLYFQDGIVVVWKWSAHEQLESFAASLWTHISIEYLFVLTILLISYNGLLISSFSDPWPNAATAGRDEVIDDLSFMILLISKWPAGFPH